VLELVDNIRKSRTRTIIIITHDEDTAKVADRVVHMVDGELIDSK
jgi:ABC-type lipoprotein export system ATPase subunit